MVAGSGTIERILMYFMPPILHNSAFKRGFKMFITILP
jgi:hypothetical protein